MYKRQPLASAATMRCSGDFSSNLDNRKKPVLLKLVVIWVSGVTRDIAFKGAWVPSNPEAGNLRRRRSVPPLAMTVGIGDEGAKRKPRSRASCLSTNCPSWPLKLNFDTGYARIKRPSLFSWFAKKIKDYG